MQRTMLLMLVVCMLITSGIAASVCDVTDAANLVISLRRILSCDSITVLRSGNNNRQQENELLVKMIRQFSDSDVLSATLDMQQHTVSSNATLHVLTAPHHKTSDYINSIPWRKPGDSRWLLFLDQGVALENVIGEVFLPLHCQLLVASCLEISREFALVEVYRIAPGRALRRLQFGTWSRDVGLRAPITNFLFRRRDLHGVVIRGGTIFGSSISNLKENKDSLNGFDGHAWSLLEEILNFKTEVLVSPQRFGGSRLDNGSWSGLVGFLQSREIQVTVNLILMSSLRAQVVHFSVPLLQIHEDIFVRHSLHNAIDWGNYLAPFSSGLWLALLATASIITISLCTISKLTHDTTTTPPDWCDLLFYVQGALLQQGQAPPSNCVPSRIACVTCYLTAIVILGAYSASIISSLTLRTPELPFTSLEELLHSRTHRFATCVPSAEFFLFKEASEGVLKDVYTRLLLPELQDLPSSDLEGLRRVCDRHNYAYFTTTEYILVYLNDLMCAVTTLPRHVFVFHVALGFPRNSPYIGIFNYAIQRTQETGLLRRLKNHALTHIPREVPETYVPVEIRNVVPIFTLLACGIGFSLVLLALEVRVYHTLATDTFPTHHH